MVFSFRFWWLCISKHTEGVPMAQLFATGIYTTIWTLPQKQMHMVWHDFHFDDFKLVFVGYGADELL